MKFTKLFFNLGAISLLFSSCSDELNEIQSESDNSIFGVVTEFDVNADNGDFIDIDENQTSFTLPVTRTTTSRDSVTVIVKCEVETDIFSYKLPDGTDVAFQPKDGKYVAEVPVTFAPNETSASILFKYPWYKFVDMLYLSDSFEISIFDDISGLQLLHKPIILRYVPWHTVTGPNGETKATWIDRAIFSGITFSGGDPIDLFTWEVTIQSTYAFPGLYRVINPYEGVYQAPEEDGTLTYNGKGTIYMYINAMDPDNVFLSDKVGNPLPEFNSYYTLIGEYGDIHLFDRVAGSLAGKYLYDDGSFSNDGAGLGTRVDFEKGGDTYVHYINFAEGHFFVCANFDGYEFLSDELQIVFPGGEPTHGWKDLGMATYTEDMLSAYYGMGVQTYQVPVQQNIENPSVYRIFNAYTNYWPGSVPLPDDYAITINCSDPEFVLVPCQNMGNCLDSTEGKDYLHYGAKITNAAFYYTQQYKKTRAEIISAGLNDTFKDGVINIKNAIALAVDADGINEEDSFFCAEEGATGCKVVLPTEKAATESYATTAASNKGKKDANNPLKIVKLFGLNQMK